MHRQPEFTHLGSWGIAPDGKRFVIVGRVAADSKSGTPPVPASLMIRPTEADVRELRVVVDWFEELRRGPS